MNCRSSPLPPAVGSTLVWGKHAIGSALLSHLYALLSLYFTLCPFLLATFVLSQVHHRTCHLVQEKKKSWTSKKVTGIKKHHPKAVTKFHEIGPSICNQTVWKLRHIFSPTTFHWMYFQHVSHFFDNSENLKHELLFLTAAILIRWRCSGDGWGVHRLHTEGIAHI